MKALTVSQPFAWLIARGIKRVENRSWWTSYRGPLLIHAGKGTQYRDDFDEMREEWWPGLGIPSWGEIEKGAIVAVAMLDDCVRPAQVAPSQREWAEGPWCWLLSEVRPAGPLPYRGAQGLFEVPDGLVGSLVG